MSTTQKRFWNWLDEDSTFDLSRWHIGLIDAGVYRGFDPYFNNLQLLLQHTTTGAIRTKIDKTFSSNFGVLVTKQGVVVQEDAQIELTVVPSTTSRIDLIVFEHEYKELQGGIPGIYKIIEGTAIGVVPDLTNPSIQIPIGELYLPDNCNNLSNGAIFTKYKAPTFANNHDFIEKENGFFITDLSAEGNKIINLQNPTQSQDAATKYYVDWAIATNTPPATETNRGVIEIADLTETLDGVDDQRAITPLKLQKKIENRTASQAEVNLGTEDGKFITPKTLHNRTATESRTGIARIATQAEIDAGTDDSTIVTPFKLKQFLGLNQQIVEIGSWDLDSNLTIIIPHTYDWWPKVVASECIFIDDSNTRRDNNANGNLPNISIDGSNITIDMGAGTYTDYNSSTLPNRGWIVFWVKADIVQPPSILNVNAGVDVSESHRLLRWGTPVLNSIERVLPPGSSGPQGVYPSSLPLLQANITLGLGNNLGTFKMYAKRVNSQAGNTWNDWKRFDSYPSLGVAGYIPDTMTTPPPGMDGFYYIKVVCEVLGLVLESNTIQVDLTNRAVGYIWNATGSPTSQITYRQFNLNGLVESIGATVTNTEWEFISSPSGSNPTIDDINSENTFFITDVFGIYVLRLNGENSNGDTAYDEVTFNIAEISNLLPTAIAKWALDNTDTPKTDTVNAFTNPVFPIALQGGFSSDADGTIIGYHWQWRKVSGDGFGWYDIDTNSSTFPNTPNPIKNIPSLPLTADSPPNVSGMGGSGTYEFRVRVKDNFGGISDWSNSLQFGLTATNVPSANMTMTIISGGSGMFNTFAQLSITPIAAVHRLVARTDYYNIAGASQVNDFYFKVAGAAPGANQLQYYSPAVGVERDITTVFNSGSSNVMIWIDLNNIPPTKTCGITFIAYDINNNVLGTRQITMGHH